LKRLKLAEGLEVPIDIATQKLAWIGTTGSGKTYGALKLAELMWHAGIQFAAIDTMGIWYGLRLDRRGTAPGIPITVFGGQHGDLPIRPVDGALIAEVIVREAISAVIDVSGFDTDAEKATFASDFADRLYRLKTTSPSAIHLFLEEAHEFIPQNPMGNETMMLHHFNRIWKQGRNFGIGGSIITQRPQDVAKKSLELSAAVFAFNTTGSNTLDAMVKWLKDVPDIRELPKLPMGKDARFMLYSPAWLKQHGEFRILERETCHASFDPYSSQAIHSADRRLAPVAIEGIRMAMACAVDEAEDNDLHALKKKVEALTGELAAVRPSDAQIAAEVAIAIAPLERRNSHLEWMITELREIFSRVEALLTLEGVAGTDEAEQRSLDIPADLRLPSPAPTTAARRRTATPAQEPSELNATQRRIVEAMASLLSLGKPACDRRLVAALSGQSWKSGSYGQHLAVLRRLELIETTGDGLALTAKGKELVPKRKPPTLTELHSLWCEHLNSTQVRMFKAIVSLHPKLVTRDELARLTNQSPKSGSYGQNVARLRALGLIQGSKELGATSLVFPGGLR